MRGRWAGSEPRFMRRFAARLARSAGLAAFILGLAARRDLLGLFQAEQQLIFRQRLGAAAEAMALQLLDDLAQPLVLDPLGKQHRLQRAGIVGKRIRQDRHGASRPCRRTASRALRSALIHFAADQPGCSGAGVSRAS